MSQFEDFTRDDDIKQIVGIGETLEGAYEEFARKVAELVAKKLGKSPNELPPDYFDDKPITTYVQVIVQPHNAWVKSYWVKAY